MVVVSGRRRPVEHTRCQRVGIPVDDFRSVGVPGVDHSPGVDGDDLESSVAVQVAGHGGGAKVVFSRLGPARQQVAAAVHAVDGLGVHVGGDDVQSRLRVQPGQGDGRRELVAGGAEDAPRLRVLVAVAHLGAVVVEGAHVAASHDDLLVAVAVDVPHGGRAGGRDRQLDRPPGRLRGIGAGR